MCVALTKWAWEQVGLSPTEKLILVALGWLSQAQTSESSVSQGVIMKMTGLSERAVRGTLGALQDRDLVTVIRRQAENGAILTNTYRIGTSAR